MARKPRDRYRIKNNVYVNGQSLEGLECVHMGMVGPSGKKSSIKADNTYHHLRIDEPRSLKALGLTPALHRDRFVADQHLKMFHDGPL